MRYRRLWMGLTVVVVGSFAVLGYFGRELYRQAPPIPNRVVTAGGEVLFTGQDIKDGQNVWQSMGGQEVGTVWGHGAYVAPDWSADWLHREAGWILDHWAKAEHEKPFAELSPEIQEGLKARLRAEVRTNTYDPATGDLTVSPVRAQAIAAVGQHYAGLFGSDPEMQKLRLAYAIPENQIKDPERQRKMNAFFFWAAWACATERPGSAVTYTNNWPAEDLIGNRPSGQILVWSLASIILLLGGVGALAWYIAAQRKHGEEPHAAPANDPLLALQPTPSMRATLKYFWVVAALIIAQVVLGAVTAHYGVEGDGFYGIAGQVAAVFGDTHLAHPARHLLDRYRLAGHGVVYRSGSLRIRAQVPARGGQLPVRVPADHRGRVAVWAVAGCTAEAGFYQQFLVRPPGL